jgi:hypothetical protein
MHDSGVVDEAVEPIVLDDKRSRKASYGGQAAQVKFHHFDRATLASKVNDGLFSSVNATTASNYVGTLANQLRCGREPDT